MSLVKRVQVLVRRVYEYMLHQNGALSTWRCFDHRSYMATLLDAHNRDFSAVKRILLNDRAALGVVAALLVATNLSSLNVTHAVDQWHGLAHFCRVALHSFSAITALACVWIGTEQYLKLNMLPPEGAFQYKQSLAWFEEPILWMSLSLGALPPAIILGVFLIHDIAAGFISLFTVLIVYIPCIALVISSARKYHTAQRTGEERTRDGRRA